MKNKVVAQVLVQVAYYRTQTLSIVETMWASETCCRFFIRSKDQDVKLFTWNGLIFLERQAAGDWTLLNVFFPLTSISAGMQNIVQMSLLKPLKMLYSACLKVDRLGALNWHLWCRCCFFPERSCALKQPQLSHSSASAEEPEAP